MRPLRVLLSVGLLLAAGFGCELLESATTFTIDSGWQELTLDTSQLGVSIPGGGTTLPSIPCTKNSQCGSALKCGGPKASCALKCMKNKCALEARVEHYQQVDLSQKIKSQTGATALSKVSLSKVEHKADFNTLNFDTPKLQIYQGPQTASVTSDPGVVLFAEMDPIPRGTTFPPKPMNLTSQGTTAMENAVKNYQTPFRLFGTMKLTFKAGDALPRGLLKLKIKAYFSITPFG